MVHAASSAVSAWGAMVSGGIGMGARCWAVSAWSTMVSGGIGMEYHGVGRYRHRVSGVPWCRAPGTFLSGAYNGPIFIFSERVVQGGTPAPCGIGRLLRVACGVDRLVRVAWPIWHGFWAIKGAGPIRPLEHVNSRWRSA